eukprot:gene11416-biopygen21403
MTPHRECARSTKRTKTLEGRGVGGSCGAASPHLGLSEETLCCVPERAVIVHGARRVPLSLRTVRGHSTTHGVQAAALARLLLEDSRRTHLLPLSFPGAAGHISPVQPCACGWGDVLHGLPLSIPGAADRIRKRLLCACPGGGLALSQPPRAPQTLVSCGLFPFC